MKNINKFIVITILVGIGFLAANAQEQTVTVINEGSTEKVEKIETAKKRQSSNDDSWTGFYVGGYVGNTNNRAAANTSTVYSDIGYFSPTSIPEISKVGAQKLTSNRVNVGGTFGYTKQVKRFVVGAEVDFGSQRFDKSVSGTGTYPCCAPEAFTINQSVKNNWLLTVRPRAGFATKKVFVYATGGLAVTKINYSENFNDTFSASQSGNFNKTKAGWTVGAGVEAKVARQWSVKGEYLFNQFNRNTITSNNLNSLGIPFSVNVFTHSTDLKSHNLRFGINYRF